MRIDLKKYLFIGHHNSLETFFQKAQDVGVIHFIDKRKLKYREVSDDIKTIMNAIKILHQLPPLKQVEPESLQAALLISSSICETGQGIEELKEKIRILKLEIARNEVFGNFSIDDVKFIEEKGNRKIQFFFAKKGRFKKEKIPPELFYITSAFGLDYFISINKEMTQYTHLVEMKIDEELSKLKENFVKLSDKLHLEEQKLKVFAKYHNYLHKALTEKYNDFHLRETKHFVEEKIDGKLFAIDGWIPENKTKKLNALIKELDVDATPIAIEKDEVAPTYLENQDPAKIGEDLVQIYDTPSNEDKDPSLWVLLSFAVFFAMIIGDGGYGLIFLAAALYIRYKKQSLSAIGARMWKLTVILSLSCIIWGLFSNSFFGIKLAPENPLREYSVTNWLMEKKADFHFNNKDDTYREWIQKFPELEKAKNSREFLFSATKESKGKVSYEMIEHFNDSILMELAILVGIIHIMLSFLRYVDKAPSGIGWILAILGAYLYLPQMLKANTLIHYAFGFDRDYLANEGIYMMYGGLTISLVLAIIKDKIYGLLELTKIIQIFADILSYLRLYALALAGSIISTIVNEISSSLFLMGGVIVLILGHGLNMTLSVAGGIIHGLRLNFIEWYHYSFFGGGKVFDPLRKIKIE